MVFPEEVLVEHEFNFVLVKLDALLLNVVVDLAEGAEDLEGGPLGPTAGLGSVLGAGT